VEKIDNVSGEYSLSCKFRNVGNNVEWVFSGVYGPNSDAARGILWDELAGIGSWWSLPWCIGGDFNVVRYPTERLKGGSLASAMWAFTDFINELDLIDLPLIGGNYTWSSNPTRPAMSRLDRFLVSPEWDGLFASFVQSTLPCRLSDHFPILLDCGRIQGGKTSFKFENMWLQSEQFVDRVSTWWESYVFEGSPSFVFSQKLRALKQDLKMWNKEVFGDVGGRKSVLMEEIQKLDAMEEMVVLSREDQQKREGCREELNKVMELDEICWRQKSQAVWLKEGDRNTKFFHRLANSHRRNNFIGALDIDEHTTVESEEITAEIVQYYQNLYSETTQWRPKLDGLLFNSLTSVDAIDVIRLFDEEEVQAAVTAMPGDKAPGPDGFTLAFYQKCWSVLKADVMRVFHHFHAYGSFVKSLNATFVTLIPKKAGAKEVKDFRPISLLGSLYKILAKVLANRLRVVLGNLITPTQNAFIKGRQILDSVLIASECIDSILIENRPRILCKLDLEKAYDHVNWNFLLYMLERLGFPERWRSWMLYCISTVRLSILVNGTPSGFFDTSRGIRQGDPLSPLLFVVVMEAFSKLMQKAEEENFIRGFEIRGRNQEPIQITHLCYADDTILFCEPILDQVGYVKCTLLCFEAASRLKVNLSKSEMVQIGNVSNLSSLAAWLDCKISTVPMKYLGMPLGARFKSKQIWDPILEKLGKKLAGWKHLYLSKGGRLTLLKSTLSGLPLYYLSLYPIPVSVIFSGTGWIMCRNSL
jgi:hypothetical protein